MIANAQPAEKDTCKTCCNYWMVGKKVYLFDEQIKGADARTFKCIRDEYAKDKHHVYFSTKRFDTADAATFVVLEHGYSKDTAHVYYDYYSGKMIAGADPASFVVLDLDVAKDKDHVYIQHKLGHIEQWSGADAATFEVRSGYYVDKGYLYNADGDVLARRDTFDVDNYLRE